ncbi:uncharacterized protein LOC127831775 [Dreissena polymorpha]|uniref:THAP-type domain-containing protein n=1 Tax=Dreissena polymorpha TaxID=45954 RepID=A0A9D4MU89_DREPO|nr:uncharacterized protein LOC127831775 [Dreissena polymorpha]KAH3882548.1 hypothetical protein DPMN_006489 [Dreissena polymorpha]
MCKCDPPFRLFAFPTKIRASVERGKWKQLIGGRNGNKLWSPSKDSRLCCSHFVDWKPTKDNPNPTVNLGYDGAEKRVKRMTLFDATSHRVNAPKKRRLVTKPEPLTAVVIHDDPDMEALPKSELKVPFVLTLLVFVVGLLLKLHEQFVEIQKLKEKISELRGTVNYLKNNVCTEEILQNDKEVTFFTGLNCKSAFYKLHSLVAPFVNRKWRGVLVSKERISKREDDTIGSKCQLLLTLIKLRLGLLNKDLAKRFCISETLCSRIFFTWLRALRTVLECKVYIPDEETLKATNPQRFRKLKNLHTIIDCEELFIETPKDLHLQSASWSDYKHHNTLKFLVASTPNSSIVSPAYMGRISDKALTVECGNLNRVPQYYYNNGR